MAIGAAEIYYWSMDPADLDRVPAVVTHAGAQHGVLEHLDHKFSGALEDV